MKKILKITSILGLILASSLSFAAITNGAQYGAWKGVCQKNQCMAIQEVKDEKGVTIAGVSLDNIKGNKVAVITLPLMVDLEIGLGLAVDGKEIKKFDFQYCDPIGCHSFVPLEGNIAEKLKAGNKMQIGIFYFDKQKTIEFSLNGITKAIDAL